MDWAKLLWVIGAVIIGFLVYRMIHGNPQMFSKANLNKSFYTMALLALGLIVFIGLLVLMLRN